VTASTTAIRFMISPSLGDVRDHVRVELFGRALSERLGRQVVLELAPTYEALEAELAAGRVDLAWGTAEQCNAFEPQARAVLRAVRSGSWYYYSALVCRAEEPLSLETLAGKRAAWVAPRSTGGHLLPVRHLEKHGVRPDEVLSEQRYLGTYRKALCAVLSGEADVAAVYCNHADEPAIRATLANYVGAEESRLLPFLFTEPTLADGIIVTRRLSEEDAASLVSALTEMNTDGGGLEMLMGPFRVEGFVLASGEQPRATARPLASAEYVVAELDEEARCLRLWSPTGRAFGRDVSGAEGRPLVEVLGPEAGEPLLSLMGAVRQGGSGGRLEYRLEVEGRTRWYAAEITPCAPVPGDTRHRLSVLVRDVSGLRSLEEPLYRLASFPLLHPEPLLELSMDGLLRYANPATHKAFPDLGGRGGQHPLVKAWCSCGIRRACGCSPGT
jgi:two-component system NtrC family sensor kinase